MWQIVAPEYCRYNALLPSPDENNLMKPVNNHPVHFSEPQSGPVNGQATYDHL